MSSLDRWLIRAWYYDANTAYLGYQDVDSAYGGYSSANWQQEGGQLTLPQGTAQVAIQLYNHESSGWVAFDDVSLVRTDQSSANETSYYFFGGRRVAMRGPDGVYYLHGDHLSSTSLVTDDDGDLYASRRYRPYGEPRPLSGTLPTDRTFSQLCPTVVSDTILPRGD